MVISSDLIALLRLLFGFLGSVLSLSPARSQVGMLFMICNKWQAGSY